MEVNSTELSPSVGIPWSNCRAYFSGDELKEFFNVDVQAMVDCARAAILMPLGTSILYCRPVNKCSLVETAFLLLVSTS